MTRYFQRITILISLFLSVFHFTACQKSDSNLQDYIKYSLAFNVDEKNRFTIDNVEQIPFVKDKNMNLGFFRGTIWIKINIENLTNNQQEAVILNNDKFNRSYRFYKLDTTQRKLISQSNRIKLTHYDHRSYSFTSPNFKMVLAPKEKATYYVNTYSDGRVVAAASKVLMLDQYLKKTNQESISDTLFYCTVLIIFLINLFYAFVLKKKVFAFYILYICFIGMLYLGLDGYLFARGLPHHAIDHLVFIFLRLTLLFFILFSSAFLNFKAHFPKLYRYAITTSIAVFSGMTLYQLVFYYSSIRYLHVIENFVALGSFLLVFVIIILSIKNSIPELKYYIAALSCYFFLIAIGLIFSHFGLDAKMNIQYYTFFRIGTIIEIVIFTYTIVVLMGKNELEINEVKAKSLIKEEEYKKNLNIKLVESHDIDIDLINSKLSETLSTKLTKRELDVLVELCKGKKNKEISESLFISVNTVRSHLLKMYEKMGVESRTQAIKMAENLSRLEKDSE